MINKSAWCNIAATRFSSSNGRRAPKVVLFSSSINCLTEIGSLTFSIPVASPKSKYIVNENLINWDGDVTLVEGPFDHLVVPNSIPLLGKTINSTYYLFDEIINKSNQNIIVFLDNDAYDDAIQVCKRLSRYELCGRLRIVNTNKLLNKLNNLRNLNLNKLDPGKLFELYGKKGIAWAICQSEEYQCI